MKTTKIAYMMFLQKVQVETKIKISNQHKF